MSASKEIIQAELPGYEPPPQWIAPRLRKSHPNYDNEIELFLPRQLDMNRPDQAASLGFNIRGGQERSFGIFVSKVIPGTAAHNCGLKEGDQILRVNDFNFETIGTNEAVRILKGTLNVQLVVRYFPYGYLRTYDKPRTISSS